MTDEFSTSQNNKGRNSLLARCNRISARAIHPTRRSTLSSDSITGSNGVPIGVFWGRENERDWYIAEAGKQGRQNRNMKLIKHYPISVTWWAILLTVGAILQVVIK